MQRTDKENVKLLSLEHRGDYDLFHPDLQNVLIMHTWSKDVKKIADLFYEKSSAEVFIDRMQVLTKVETACRKVTDAYFATMNDERAMFYKAILQEFPYLTPPKAGHKEEWLYQNEFMMRVWQKEWEQNWPDEPNMITQILESDVKMHHLMKWVIPKARSIPRDRRHNQTAGFGR